VLARNGERERQHREDVLVVGDDLFRRAAPDRVRIDPRDHERDDHDPRELLEVAEEPPAEERRRAKAREVGEHVDVGDREHGGEHREREPDRQQQPPRP